MATAVVLTDYTLTVIAFNRLRFVQFMADSQEEGNWHITDEENPSYPIVPNMERSLQILKHKVTCIVNNSSD